MGRTNFLKKKRLKRAAMIKTIPSTARNDALKPKGYIGRSLKTMRVSGMVANKMEKMIQVSARLLLILIVTTRSLLLGIDIILIEESSNLCPL
jgi:hypothetical protein